MNIPSLNYQPTGLQFGGSSGMSGYTAPDLGVNPFASQVSPWQGDLSTAVNQNSYQSLGLDSNGMYVPKMPGGGVRDWLSSNSGLVQSGLNALVGGYDAYNGMRQNKLLERNMNQQASQYREQMDLSKQNINRNLEDRQRARVASNATAYESVSDYMKKYGVK